MKTYKMKRVVVGIMLVILTLGFCVVGTGAAAPNQMGGPGGQGGPMGQMGGSMGRQGYSNEGGPGFNGQSFGPGSGFDGQTTPEGGSFAPEGESFPGGFGPGSQNGAMDQQDFGPNGESGFNGQFSHDGGFGPGDQRGFGGRGGFDRNGGPAGMDNDVRQAIDALEDGETKTNLETLMENVHTAMEALHNADDESREAAETGVKDARDALNTALEAAGIDASVSAPPEKPEGDESAARPEQPENGNQTRPEIGGRQNGPDFLSREALEGIDLEDEEQVQDLFQQFLSWIKSSKT